jgi:hypothetical protein
VVAETAVLYERKRPLPVRPQQQLPTAPHSELGDEQSEAEPVWVLRHERKQRLSNQSSDCCARRAEEPPEDEGP